LINLAEAHSDRYWRTENSGDLSLAIKLWESAICVGSASHPIYPWFLDKLADCLTARFELSGDLQDLDDAIERRHTQFNDAGPPGDPTPLSLLYDLATALHARFEQRDYGPYLQLAISYLSIALERSSPGHPDRSSSLTHLAIVLRTRYRRQGDQQDLALVIHYHEIALDLRPPGHPDRYSSLSNLADALLLRFRDKGDFHDVELAIEHASSALHLCTVKHPDYPSCLDNYAKALYTRFGVQGESRDLDLAMAYFGSALVLRPPGHPKRSLSLNNLARALRSQFKLRRTFADLDLAIDCYKCALDLCPPGHANRSQPLNNLATVLMTRLQEYGDIRDLESAIDHLYSALALRPPGHPERSSSLLGIARVLMMRYDLRGNTEDLVLAIHYDYSALELQPPGHPRRATTLMGLAVSLLHRGTPEDIELAIKYYRDVLELRPQGHPDHHSSLHNLATALYTRSGQQSGIGDLELAITYYSKALESISPRHTYCSLYLTNLADALVSRSKRLGQPTDLTSAFGHLHALLDSLPQAHPLLFNVYKTLSRAHSLRHSVTQEPADRDEVFACYRLASTHPAAGSWNCLLASLKWIAASEQQDHTSKLEAYRTTLNILDRHVIATSSIQRRHAALRLIPPSISSDAASCAIREGQLDVAVELLEQGRALLWAQLARFRTPLDSLRNIGSHGQQLARKFERISRLLDSKHASDLQKSHEFFPSELSIAKDARHYRELTEDWETVVEQIRQTEGFTHFLMSKPFSELQSAALHGPVIVVNISRYSCDAIIVLRSGPPRHLSLSRVTYEDISSLSTEFASVLKKTAAVGEERIRERQLIPILRQLWECIVFPIVKLLGTIESEVPKGSRIWWCPTSKLSSLPLHAAGSYRRSEPNLAHFFVSSYTPTLSALIRSRKTPEAASNLPGPPHRFIAIGQAQPHENSNETDLQSVDTELELIKKLAPSSISYSQLTGNRATVDTVIDAFRKNEWIHLACHGKQDLSQAFDSCFALRDKSLSLMDIIHAGLDHPEFAFLSACHTAAGDKDMPDEVIHLAAGIQFSGFRSVIGTMWAVDDATACHMVSQFYSNLFQDGADYTHAAVALDKAAKTVNKKEVPLDQRIVFIHIG
ncbi:hypothetical protein SERLA73DRAFT_19643, partial [Serpula lacrymans var. lacrymans S7.3]